MLQEEWELLAFDDAQASDGWPGINFWADHFSEVCSAVTPTHAACDHPAQGSPRGPPNREEGGDMQYMVLNSSACSASGMDTPRTAIDINRTRWRQGATPKKVPFSAMRRLTLAPHGLVPCSASRRPAHRVTLSREPDNSRPSTYVFASVRDAARPPARLGTLHCEPSSWQGLLVKIRSRPLQCLGLAQGRSAGWFRERLRRRVAGPGCRYGGPAPRLGVPPGQELITIRRH